MSLMVKDKSFYKSFFALTLVIAMQNLIVFSVNLADNVMLGAYSEYALSGVALVNQIQFMLQMLIAGLGEGVVIMCSRYWGSRNISPIKKVISIAMSCGIVIAVLMFIFVFFFPQTALGLFTKDAGVISEGVKYLSIICFSYVFFAITNILIASLRSVETVKIGFVISLSTLCVNVCLNYILIYGNFGAPELGVRGAAIATLIARIIETIVVLVYVFRIDQKIKICIRDFFSYDMVIIKNYVKVTLPVFLANSIWGLNQGVQTSILGHMGQASIAANSISTTIFQIVSVLAYGSASATSVIIGKTIGEGNVHKVKSYAKTMQVLYLCIGIVTGLALFLLKDVVLSFYDISESSRALALQFMTVLSITVVGTSYQMPALTGVVRGGGDTTFVLYNDLIFIWLVVIPSAALSAFVFGFSPIVVFACLKCDQVLKCFVAVIKVNRFKWIKHIN